MNYRAGLVCGSAATLILLAAAALADSENSGKDPSLVGAWEVQVTVRQDAADCTAGPLNPFGPNPFPALYTFHEDGTISETGSRSPPSARSPGHGVWKRARHSAYRTHQTFQRFDASGFLSSTMDTRSSIKLSKDGNSFTAVGRLELTDISGNTFKFCHTMEGFRFAL